MNMKKKFILFLLTLGLVSATVSANDYSQHWAKTAITKWQDYGIVKGYEDQSFRPNNNITRAEFAAIISRVFDLAETRGADTYLDLVLEGNKWYAAPIQKVSSAGLMHIEGDYFNPNQLMTREEAAYSIARAYEMTAEGTPNLVFTDSSQISDWARDAVSTLTKVKYINGNPDGSFRPQGTLTRAELVTMLENITQQLIMKPGTYSQSVSGNVIVSSGGVTLKDMTIEGNLYLTQGIGEGQVSLENVTVKGKVFINGGTVNMSGQFTEVKIASSYQLSLTEGRIGILNVQKTGAQIKVDALGVIEQITGSHPYSIEGTGKVEGKELNQLQEMKITSAGVYINDEYVSLPVSNNCIMLDVPALSRQFKREDVLSGLSIQTNLPDSTLYSQWGEMRTGTVYTFRKAEKALGFIQEMAIEAGINPNLVVGYIFGSEQLTIGGLLDDYRMAQQLSVSMNMEIKDSYELIRGMNHSLGKANCFTVEMRLK